MAPPGAEEGSVAQGRVVVVTGGSAGVGRAAVRAFAERGDDVAVLARDTDGVQAAVKEVEAAGRRAVGLTVDVADAGAVESAAATVEERLGPIDVWVNNAMTSVFAPFKDVEPDEFRRVTEVAYLGFVYGTKAALRRMLPRDRGAIVQVGSALAHRGIPLQSAYCGSKHAIKGFTEAVRCELLHDKSNVRITMVQMPALNTPQFGWVLSRLPKKPQPVPPIYQPEVAARAIVWASEHDRGEVWVGGSTFGTILAQRLVPRLLDRYLARTGYTSQQTDEPADPDSPANLWHPVAGDHGAHGDFDAQAKGRSAQWWLTSHRAPVAAVLGAAGVGAARVLGSFRN
jgi:NAD(P)-dependent dehydrogenase (short-subunit alcohol dehydrogenase family)